MKWSILYIVIILSICCIVNASSFGVDVSDPVDKEKFVCLLKNNYTFAIVRAFRSIGSPDLNSPKTVANAWAAGLHDVGVYFFPCPKCSSSPESQVQASVNFLDQNKVNYTYFWFDIEGTEYWLGDCVKNEKYLRALITKAQQLNLKIGIYSSKYQWTNIFCQATGYEQFPLWYAHYDKKPSFEDFVPFGGWQKPVIKQFFDELTICGDIGADVNYKENF